MHFAVAKDDSLVTIARDRLGDPHRWGEIARLNQLGPPYRLLVGEIHELPTRFAGSLQPALAGAGHAPPSGPVLAGRQWLHDADRPATAVPARAYLLVLADEPASAGRAARQVLTVPLPSGEAVADAPGLFGLEPGADTQSGASPDGPRSPASAGDNARVLDPQAAQRLGLTRVDPADLRSALDRLAGLNPALGDRIGRLLGLLEPEKSPPSAGSSPPAPARSDGQGMRVAEVIGLIVSAYDVGRVDGLSCRRATPQELASARLKCLAGWGSEWLGFRLAGLDGTAVAIDAGPGPVPIAALGGITYGTSKDAGMPAFIRTLLR
jgi:hypothetical protein